jgi:Cytochrome C oxidase, cbb3-type, subunit III
LAWYRARTTFAAVTAIAFGREGRLVWPRAARGVWLAVTLLPGLSPVLACDRPPPPDSLAEWTPADHHSTDDDRPGQGAQQSPPRQPAAPKGPRGQPTAGGAAGAGAPAPAAAAVAAGTPGTPGTPETPDTVGGGEAAQLADLAWRQQCSTCHGTSGRGDGQLGPMVRAPDLTREDWQSRVTDAEIAATIRHGKGKMPNFDVPDSVIEGLVARVRAARGR